MEPFVAISTDSIDGYEFTELRENGRTVYKDGIKTIKYNKNKGFWKYMGIEKDVSDIPLDSQISNGDATKLAEEFFEKLALPEEEKGSIYSRGIGISTEEDAENQTGKVIARHAQIHRKINGYKVYRSRLLAIFNMDEELIQVEVRWPDFKLKPNCTICTEDELADIYSDNPDAIFGNIDNVVELHSEIVYLFDEDTLYHYPAMRNFVRRNDEYLMSVVTTSICKEDLPF